MTPQIVELEIEDPCDLGGLSANELPKEELEPAISEWFVDAFIARIPFSAQLGASLTRGNYPTYFIYIFIYSFDVAGSAIRISAQAYDATSPDS